MRSDNPFQVTIADNVWRLEKFRTYTILAEECGKKVVYKCAATEKGEPFMKLIAKREKANVDYLRKHFEVLCGKLEGHRLRYEYLPCQSLEQTITSQLREGNCDKADATLRLYVDKVRALNTVHTYPGEFFAKIAQEPFDNDGMKVDCLTRGLLDLTPRNIHVDGNRWIVIDNEWSFDFPIPVVFILFRAILELVVGLQDEIRRCTKKTRPAVGIFARGLRTYYFPKEWVEYVVDPHISFAQMLRWEMSFRQYIAGSSGGTVGRLKMSHRTKFHFSMWSLRCNSGIIESVSHFLKKFPVIRRLVYFFERTLLFFTK